jgi:hypothetical protein
MAQGDWKAFRDLEALNRAIIDARPHFLDGFIAKLINCILQIVELS